MYVFIHVVMCLNLSPPRFIPQYHLVITTMWSYNSAVSIMRSIIAPAPLSPSSFLICVPFDKINAQVLCVAFENFLFRFKSFIKPEAPNLDATNPPLTAYFEPLSDKKFTIIFMLGKQYRFFKLSDLQALQSHSNDSKR